MSESDYEKIVVHHYNLREVQEEIAKFSRSRWVALHCEFLNPQGYQVLLRYQWASGKVKVPLTINEPKDVAKFVERFKRLKPRAFYASVNVYKELTHPEHVKSLENIAYCTPTWDIDNTPEKWEATIAVAKEIVSFLNQEGVSESVFLKWSGKGVHVHIHERALSENLLKKVNPLDAAYAIVDYVNRKLDRKYVEIAQRYQAQELSAENELDLQRVFTCPLSLHRSLNRVAVCFSASTINDFVPPWTDLERYHHWKGWDQFEAGEADKLAEKAYRTVGAYPFKTQTKTSEPTGDFITKWLKKDT
jgi:hypothetical protein